MTAPREIQFRLPDIKHGISPEEEFRQYANAGIANALGVIQSTLEVGRPENGFLSYTYHTRPHTVGVINRATKLAKAAGLSSREIQLIRLKAAFHDVKQIGEVQDQNGAVKRVRPRKYQNEEKSAALAVAYMQQVNKQRNVRGLSDVYTAAEMASMSDIDATIPGWNPDLRTVTQPYYTQKGIDGKILSLADLGGSGIDADCSQWEAAALFDEENADYRRYRESLSQATRRRVTAKRDTQLEQHLYERLMTPDKGWLDAQIAFIKGREIMLPDEIKDFSSNPMQREALRKQFSSANFTASRAQLEALKAEIADKPFDEWSATLDRVIRQVPPSMRKLEE